MILHGSAAGCGCLSSRSDSASLLLLLSPIKLVKILVKLPNHMCTLTNLPRNVLRKSNVCSIERNDSMACELDESLTFMVYILPCVFLRPKDKQLLTDYSVSNLGNVKFFIIFLVRSTLKFYISKLVFRLYVVWVFIFNTACLK